MQNISEIRKEYTQASLDADTVCKDPIKQFEKWLTEALRSEVPEPTAMNVATVNEYGRPSSRILLLKGIEENRLLFYTNYQSKKGRELEHNPACALTFFWPEMERQVRIEGITERLDAKESERYFQSRPRGSQIGAWASPQSSFIKDREILDERVIQITKKFEGLSTIPKPMQWGGYHVQPFLFEFWQGRPSRLHDRLQYTLIDETWRIQRLAP